MFGLFSSKVKKAARPRLRKFLLEVLEARVCPVADTLVAKNLPGAGVEPWNDTNLWWDQNMAEWANAKSHLVIGHTTPV